MFRVVSDVVEGVVLKCLNQKPKTKDKGFQLCLMFVEIERADVVQVRQVLKDATILNCLPETDLAFGMKISEIVHFQK